MLRPVKSFTVPRSWAESRVNSRLFRWAGSIPARAGVLAALAAFVAGMLISIAAFAALYVSLHVNISQSLQSRMNELTAMSPTASITEETGAGIDLVALFDEKALLKENSSVGTATFPDGLFGKIPDDGTAHSVADISARGTEFHALAQKIHRGDQTYLLVVGIESDKDRDFYLATASILAVLTPLFALLTGWLTARLVRSSLRPVEQIRTEVERISSADLGRRVPVPNTSDEISALATTMNGMLNRLDDAQQTQVRFIGDASHELRSPIATISGLVEIAQITEDPIDMDTINGILAPETARMQKLVDDLLAAASAQKSSAPREEIDLDDIVFTEKQRLVSLHPELTITTEIAPARVLGVHHGLTRALRNLTDNALKYCDQRISMSLTTSGSHAVLRVEDDGPGVPDSAKAAVLTRFGRVDAARDRASGGAGLGLSIVSDIVAGHGGAIDVKDSELGGALFEITLTLISD